MYDYKRLSEAEGQKAREAFSLLEEFGFISTSMMQRKMRVGYGRAAFFLDLFRDLGLVDDRNGDSHRWSLCLPLQDAADKLEDWLACHTEEDDPDGGRKTDAVLQKPAVKDGVDPLLYRLALTVGVNGDKRLLDQTTLQRELRISADRAQALIDVMMQTGVIQPCKQPVYEATKDGDALRRLYDYMGMEMPEGEGVDCLRALLGTCPTEE